MKRQEWRGRGEFLLSISVFFLKMKRQVDERQKRRMIRKRKMEKNGEDGKEMILGNRAEYTCKRREEKAGFTIGTIGRNGQANSGRNRSECKLGMGSRSRCATRVFSLTCVALLLGGCGSKSMLSGSSAPSGSTAESTVGQVKESLAEIGRVTLLDPSDMFTARDREVGYDEGNSTLITLLKDTAETEDTGVQIAGSTVTITKEGTYLLRGELDGSIVVEATKKDKVQLVLDGATVRCAGSAALYVKQADKVFVTTAPGSENCMESVGEFEAIDEHTIDGAIFARDDITFNGEGLLKVVCETGHGMVCKNDLAVTSGDYEITAEKHGLQGKDSIRIASGSMVIHAAQDGVHSGNAEDETVGYTYIAGGESTDCSRR